MIYNLYKCSYEDWLNIEAISRFKSSGFYLQSRSEKISTEELFSLNNIRLEIEKHNCLFINDKKIIVSLFDIIIEEFYTNKIGSEDVLIIINNYFLKKLLNKKLNDNLIKNEEPIKRRLKI